MNPKSPKLYSLALFLTLLFGGAYILFPEFGQKYEIWFFVLVMLATGIPHGATDHIVFQHDAAREGKSVSWGFFLSTYLGAMLAYSICWYFFPLLSLGIFILISAFHFGQSQLLFMEWKELHPVKVAIYLSWGLMVLFGIIGFHFEESMMVIETLIEGQAIPLEQETMMLVIQVCAGLWLSLMLCSLVKRKLSGTALFFELVNVGLLLLISSQTSVMFSFALYFGIWHSLASMFHEIRIIQRERLDFGWKQFFKEAVPFSLISFVGIGLLLLAGNYLGSMVSPYFLFFIAISTLTLPHMVFMQRLYQKKSGTTGEQSALVQVEG